MTVLCCSSPLGRLEDDHGVMFTCIKIPDLSSRILAVSNALSYLIFNNLVKWVLFCDSRRHPKKLLSLWQNETEVLDLISSPRLLVYYLTPPSREERGQEANYQPDKLFLGSYSEPSGGSFLFFRA